MEWILIRGEACASLGRLFELREVEAVTECHEPMIVFMGDIVRKVAPLLEEKSCIGRILGRR